MKIISSLFGELNRQREQRIIDLIENQNSLSEICFDPEVLKLFENVKDVRTRIRKIMNKKGYIVHNDFFILKNLIPENIEKNYKGFYELRLKKEEIKILKKIIGHYSEIEELINSRLRIGDNLLLFSENDKIMIDKAIGDYDKLKKVLLNKKTSTIKTYEIPINNPESINNTIRVNKEIYEEFWIEVSKDKYLSKLKKTDLFNIVFYEMQNKIKKANGWSKEGEI